MSQIKARNPWKRIYAKTLEASFALTLVLLMSVFFSFQTFEKNLKLPGIVWNGTIEIEPPPRTELLKKAPRPTLPSIPVEADEDDIIDGVTINYEKNIGIMEIAPPPPEPDDILYEFYQVSEKPEIIKQVKPIYPKMAQQAGITGTVTITVLIGKKGEVEDVKVFKDVMMLTEAAVQAAWKCKFKPAKQRDKYVKVWMNIPFRFTLK